MLQTQTVEKKTLRLLKTLMRDKKLRQFHLVGGTALALYMGHRKSIDIDLFSQQPFDVEKLMEHLVRTYDFVADKQSKITLIGSIDSIKVDCIKYKYPLVEPVQDYDGIRMYSMADIAAMKLTAISQSGDRLKDFVDVAFLSAKMPLEKMLAAFEVKYPNTNVMTAVRGLSYYDDIDFSVEIDLIEGDFKWKIVEKRLKEMIQHPDKVFAEMRF